ncbi:hypothetical protein G7K_1188-t1 [Saitoella complicata NRRL Y-17804]|uniref:Uncharacterized protein n=1 Tax=Saitoella complicata (strain BCRC 22490 / CBS 7301 / JCM 7358 / NBRC 10748 / NRRL Y-17804) TaxID=698492 RepID=A0A0E9NBA1_SAICN|nr:hypothetical protein G7K_1188-t1 [Saitoella complicata NRRL Y-17804]
MLLTLLVPSVSEHRHCPNSHLTQLNGTALVPGAVHSHSHASSYISSSAAASSGGNWLRVLWLNRSRPW